MIDVKKSGDFTSLQQLVPKSLYVHIPFCSSKCFYCDFNSYVANDSVKIDYVDALIREIALLKAEYFPTVDRPRLDTVFFGGGTPTLLPLNLWEKLAKHLQDHFQMDATTEWSVEANPGSVDSNYLKEIRNFGVNRVSFGAQTFNETLLLAIGRLHSARDIIKGVEMANQSGFSRISLDLMIGLPDQSKEDVLDSLKWIEKLGVKHVSVYGLKVEEATTFFKWQKAGHLHLPEEDEEGQMYEQVRNFLHERGICQYEISNFARVGEEARHNLTYWNNLPYVAVGAGAHGYVYGKRYENVKPLEAYRAALNSGKRPVANERTVDEQEAQEDSMILGLRLKRGVLKKRFFQYHGVTPNDVFGEVLSSLLKKGWLLEDEEKISIPYDYFPVASEIMYHFIRNS